MPRLLRYLLLATLLIALGYTTWWLFLRSPTQQVLAAQQNLIAAFEDRDWKEVHSSLTPDFTSTAGHTRETAIADAEQVLSQFITLTLNTELISTTATPDHATVQMKIRVQGTGSALAQIVLARANEMKDTWLFTWQKHGPWPWHWKLHQIHHPDLRLSAGVNEVR